VALKPCLADLADGRPCGVPSSGPRCAAHALEHDATRRAVYDDTRWRRLRIRVLREWRLEHGPYCPGWNVEPHVAWDLTLDHIVPIERGGAPFDRRNIQPLCRACNTRKGTDG
jgi:5-methylcytosine-specific restriction protein A